MVRGSAATVDEHLQKVGAEAFNKFERLVMFCMKSRLGISERIYSGASRSWTTRSGIKFLLVCVHSYLLVYLLAKKFRQLG